MIWKIAARNLIQHKTKSLIIGTLIALAVMLTMVGNAAINTMGREVSQSFTKNYTGDILITSSETTGAGVFGAQSEDMFGPPVIPLLKDLDVIKQNLGQREDVEAIAHQNSVYGMLNFEEKGIDYALFFGIDPVDYWGLMDNVILIDGRKILPGENAIMLHQLHQQRFLKDKGIDFKVGDTIQLNSFGDVGFVVREVPIVGIFTFRNANQRFFVPNFLDIATARALGGRLAGPKEKVVLEEPVKALLDQSEDDMFGEGFAIEVTTTSSSKSLSEKEIIDSLGADFKDRVSPEPQEGKWNFLLVKLRDGVNPEAVIGEINSLIESSGWEARAQGWQPSGAPDSYLFFFLGLIFNFAIGLLAMVSVIIIMNTLVISVMERTSEIGTMRALGAQKSKIRGLFIAETLTLSVVAGLVGMVLGTLLTIFIQWVGIPADNDFLGVLYGGSVLRPELDLATVVQAIQLILFIGLVSWIYPVSLALKISPLKAIATE